MKTGNVLVIGDTHEPFTHSKYLDFCIDTRDKYKCDKIVHIGDLVDNHAISFHEHNPDGRSSGDEVEQARSHLKKWYKAFPEVWLCKGNHDVLANRRAISHGISDKYLRSFQEVWELPKKWEYDWSFQCQGVKYQHGTGYGGKMAHMVAAQANRQSTVIGHCHSVAGCNYLANDISLIFGLSVGCGIDRNNYAFFYSKDFKDKPAIGCGVVLDTGRIGQFVPMKL